ncbi:retron system putative HNH endonuclease [Desulfobacterales bacterium HSG2]|nr:retron system putative HNH endonuclease [Desulfobacterales bacterium HSG2]
MKHIVKEAEPAFFKHWKKNDKMYQRGKPNWNRLPSDRKKELRKTLIGEQGGLCCYCGIQVSMDDSHAEHFRPKNKYPELQLEYDNLLCSCQSELQKTEPRHCGNAKGSWFDENLTVSPLDAACESRFGYLEDGAIWPSDESDEGAEATITYLALDIPKLRELRKAAIAAVLEDFDISEEEAIREQIDLYSQRNPADQKYPSFCSAIVNVLLSLLPVSE